MNVETDTIAGLKAIYTSRLIAGAVIRSICLSEEVDNRIYCLIETPLVPLPVHRT